jgi:hypothetical protein
VGTRVLFCLLWLEDEDNGDVTRSLQLGCGERSPHKIFDAWLIKLLSLVGAFSCRYEVICDEAWKYRFYCYHANLNILVELIYPKKKNYANFKNLSLLQRANAPFLSRGDSI